MSARPRRLSVTAVETWMRDPYALYAEKILRLCALDPLDADPGVAERGTLIHRALDRFVSAHPESQPEDAAAALLAIGRRVFAPIRATPGAFAFWWPRFERIVRWFVDADALRRAEATRAWGEVEGAIEIAGPAGRFRLTCKADRIDLLRDGTLAILDYKTGGVPSGAEVALGFAPQLPLEAAIAARGGFAGVRPGPATRLEFWRLTGGEPPGEIRPLGEDPGALAEAALAGLTRLVAAFDRESTAYEAVPRPERAPRFNDYAHLARIKEWSAGFGEDGA